MSVLPKKQTESHTPLYVCFVHNRLWAIAAKARALLDHLVGSGEQRRRNIKAKGSGTDRQVKW